MTEESRFAVPPRCRDCLNCGHHQFENKAVLCNHPQRPNRPAEIIRWAVGCAQHIPLTKPEC